MNKTYQEPILEIRIMAANDVVRTSDNYGWIPESWFSNGNWEGTGNEK